MAIQGTLTNTTEVKTGQGFGPITGKITLAQAIVGLVFVLLAYFGVVLPIEAYVYSVVIVSAVVGYFSKGRAYVEQKTVFEQSSVGIPVGQETTPAYDATVTPIANGTGAHRATTQGGPDA